MSELLPLRRVTHPELRPLGGILHPVSTIIGDLSVVIETYGRGIDVPPRHEGRHALVGVERRSLQ